MFKRSYNRAVLRLELLTVSPLLIKAGDAGLSRSAAQLACVRTRHAGAGSTVYIPGSSLRGVLRAAAEASLRGQRFKNVHGPVDGADDTDDARSSRQSGDATSTAETHRSHPLAARLFGSTRLKSRLSVRDLFPWPGETPQERLADTPSFQQANRTEVRNSVAIDRLLGSVKHGPWDAELVPAGVTFWGDLALENYEVWQLGLVARAIDELNDGFAQLGSGKSRGLGLVRVSVTRVVHEQPFHAGERPLGVSRLADPRTRQDYDLFPEPADALPAAVHELRGLHRRFTAEAAATAPWIDAGRRCLESLRPLS